MIPPVLEIEGLGIHLPDRGKPRRLVHDLSLNLRAGRPLALVGETGCGKSLVAQAVLGLLPPEMAVEGQIRYRGRELTGLLPESLKRLWGRSIFLFPQEPGLALNPTMRGLRQVGEVFRRIRLKSREEAHQAALEALESVSLEGRGDGTKYPCQLSGGMRQRLVAAITLAQPADLIIADEPTKGLDPELRDLVVDLLKTLSDRGKALLVITHDLETALRLGGQAAVMYDGRIMEQGPAREVLDRPCHPYPRALIKALPLKGLQPIALKLHDRPVNGGCVFAPRCAQASDLCFEREPTGGGPGKECRCHAHSS